MLVSIMGAMCSGERIKTEGTASPHQHRKIDSVTWGRYTSQHENHSKQDDELLIAPKFTYDSCQPVLKQFSNARFETNVFVREPSGFKPKKKRKKSGIKST